MSNRPGFFSLLAESQRRKDNVKRNSDREAQRRGASAATASNAERSGSNTRASTEGPSRTSTPTATVADQKCESVSLAASALGNSTLWQSYSVDSRPLKGLSDCTGEASILYARLTEANDYLDSVETAWPGLCTMRQQISILLDCAASPNEQLRFRAARTLGDVYGQLGDYDMAHSLFASLCPSLPLTRDGLGSLREWYKIDALLYYLRVSISIGRDLDQVESILRILPWATPDVLRTYDRKTPALMSLIQVLNCKGHHEDAYESLKVYELTTPTESVVDRDYHLQKAIAAAGKGLRQEAEALFVDALVLAWISSGAWNRRTLHVSYEFGRAFKAWRKDQPAVALLTNCCLGYYYSLGPSHPCSVQAYKLLESCEGLHASVQILRRLGCPQYSRERKWTMAFEQNYLTTPIEFLRTVTPVDHERVSDTLKQFLASQNITKLAEFNARRSLAWCASMQSNLTAASAALYNLYTSIKHVATDIVSTDAYRAILAADEAICFARSEESGMVFVRQRSKLVFLQMKDIPKERQHQITAILRRMKAYDLCHFTRDEVFSDPPLLTETNRESLGSGSFATVDTVQIASTFYARKSISLPRQTQQQSRLREDIQKEIEIVNTLDHPHVVRVLLTYEETRRFSIVMCPLADCDLQSFMGRKTCDSDEERRLMRQWMSCLANTLVFIHSKDVRHKDIKPSNVLVKGEKVYFTDFGSGHMFNDTGNSTTEGLAYGHTRAYCAPEVIRMDSRNRSSDVFSFGCVLAEMVAWSNDISMPDYFRAVGADTGNTDIVQYSGSLVRIRSWFEGSPLLSGLSKDIYSQVLKHMLRKKPEQRWKAVQISQAINQLVASECVKCDIELWVPDRVVGLDE